jgi:hypothetical protein
VGKSWGTADMGGLLELRDRIEQLEKIDKQKLIEGITKELAQRLLAKVIKRTPVGDYPSESGIMGGTLRRGWTAKSHKEAELSAVFGGDLNVKNYANALPINQVGDTYEVEIINPVMYSSYVEFGHRTRNHKGWVDGQFMLTISEKELDAQAPAIIERRIKKALEGVFK